MAFWISILVPLCSSEEMFGVWYRIVGVYVFGRLVLVIRVCVNLYGEKIIDMYDMRSLLIEFSRDNKSLSTIVEKQRVVIQPFL